MGVPLMRIKDIGLLLTTALVFSMLFAQGGFGGGGMGGGGMGGMGGGMGGMGGGFGPMPTGTLEVTVLGPSGAPEKDVQVSIIPTNEFKGKKKKTNAAGLAAFTKTDQRRYHVVAHKVGFTPAFEEYVNLNSDLVSVTLKMTAGVDKKYYFEDQKLDRKADELAIQGSKAIDAGNIVEAERFLVEALEIKPTNPGILYYYGLTLADQGKFDQAIEIFEKTIEKANLKLSTLPPARGIGGGGGGFGGPPVFGAPPGGGAAPKTTTDGQGGEAPKTTADGQAPAKPKTTSGGGGGGGMGGGGFGGGMGMGGFGGFGGFGGANPQQQQEREFCETVIKNAETQLNLIPWLKARTASIANRFDEAIALYDEAINANPQNADIYVEKASTLINAGVDAKDVKNNEELAGRYIADANASISKALELDSRHALALNLQQMLRSAGGGESVSAATAAKNKEAAQTALGKEALERMQSLAEEGDKLLRSSDAAGALKKYEEANALTTGTLPAIWLRIGQAHALLKQDAEAVAAFKKGIELAPADQLEAYTNALVNFYRSTNRMNEAVDLIANGRNPESQLMAIFNNNKTNPETAAWATAAIERVVKLNPANMDAVFELGQTYYLDKNDSAAREMFTKYIENGKDAEKIQIVKDFLTILDRRSTSK